MEKVVSKLVALGVPGLVLLAAMAFSGWAGGAAIVTGLALLGGPLGMMGGIALLGIMVLCMDALSKYGFESLFRAVVRGLKEKGMTIEEIQKKISSYPISKNLKKKLSDYLDELELD